MLTKRATEHEMKMKKSLEVSARGLGIYPQFKVWCAQNEITIQEGLDMAIRELLRGPKRGK